MAVKKLLKQDAGQVKFTVVLKIIFLFLKDYEAYCNHIVRECFVLCRP